MRKIDRIRNLVERKGRTVLGDNFETGYRAGVENIKKEILEIINEEIKLVDFVETEEGHRLWDSQEVRLVLKKETVFILKMNHYVELDELKLIKQSEFTKQVDKYIVEDFLTIDEVNYIFIKEKK
jgi:hypothetical protein